MNGPWRRTKASIPAGRRIVEPGLRHVHVGLDGQTQGRLRATPRHLRLVRDTNYVQLRPSDRIAYGASVSFDAATFEIWGGL